MGREVNIIKRGRTLEGAAMLVVFSVMVSLCGADSRFSVVCTPNTSNVHLNRASYSMESITQTKRRWWSRQHAFSKNGQNDARRSLRVQAKQASNKCQWNYCEGGVNK